MTDERRPGRPRIHDTPADRVRAHRERKRAEAQAAKLPAPPAADDPEAAVSALVDVLPRLRSEAQGIAEQMAQIAEQITAATTALGDKPMVDAHLNRVRAEVAKIRADSDADLADLSEQLDAALEDRANADAAAESADAEVLTVRATLEGERESHTEQLKILETSYQERTARDAAEHEATLATLRKDAAAAESAYATEIAKLREEVGAAHRERDAAQLATERAEAAAAVSIDRL